MRRSSRRALVSCHLVVANNTVVVVASVTIIFAVLALRKSERVARPNISLALSLSAPDEHLAAAARRSKILCKIFLRKLNRSHVLY